MRFARRYHYEEGHALQVTRLALQIFDGLAVLHKLGGKERRLLEAAGLLHDIGWVRGRARHHKTSRDIILAASSLPFSFPERRLVALVARYHRRAMPQARHKIFCGLSAREKRTIRKLAAMLRIADGLDWGHLSSVKALDCRIGRRRVTILVRAPGLLPAERRAACKKGDLFRQVFRKTFIIRRDLRNP